MEFSGVKTINQYQRNKFIKLFYSFQKTEPLISHFDDAHFQSIITFPYIDIQKQTNSWVVKLAILKLFTDLDVSEPNPLLRENYEIDEEELRYFAEETLSKIKTYNDS